MRRMRVPLLALAALLWCAAGAMTVDMGNIGITRVVPSEGHGSALTVCTEGFDVSAETPIFLDYAGTQVECTSRYQPEEDEETLCADKDTAVFCTPPASRVGYTGPVYVRVQYLTGTVEWEHTYEYLPQAHVTGVEPAQAQTGDVVTIRGSGFGHADTEGLPRMVFFRRNEDSLDMVEGEAIEWKSDGEVQVRVPAMLSVQTNDEIVVDVVIDGRQSAETGTLIFTRPASATATSAKLLDNGHGIEVVLDHMPPSALPRNMRFDCADVLDEATVNKLGGPSDNDYGVHGPQSAYCLYSHLVDPRIVVKFGYGATLVAGDTLATVFGNVLIGAPDNPVQPTIMISGPSRASTCDSVRMMGEVAGHGGRPAEGIAWRLVRKSDGEEVAARGMVFEWLLAAGTVDSGEYEVSLHVTNWLGQSATQSWPLTLQTPGVPQVYIDRVWPRVHAAQPLVLTTTAVASSCLSGSKLLTFEWAVAEGNDATALGGAGLEVTHPDLYVPAGTLTPGKTYTFTVTATAANHVAVHSSVSVEAQASPIEAIINEGMYVEVLPTAPFSVDGSRSVSLDGDELTFDWSVRDKDHIILTRHGRTSFFVFEQALLKAHEGQLLVLEMKVSAGDQEATAELVVEIKPGNALVGTCVIETDQLVYNRWDEVMLVAHLRAPSLETQDVTGLTYSWGTMRPNEAFTQFLIPDSVAKNERALVLRGGTLAESSAYSFRATVTGTWNGRSVRAECGVDIRVQGSPRTGECEFQGGMGSDSTLLKGVALETTFAISCYAWLSDLSDGNPLVDTERMEYAFMAWDSSQGIDEEVVLAQPSARPQVRFMLPAGSYMLSAQITDATGATTILVVAAEVSAPQMGNPIELARSPLTRALHDYVPVGMYEAALREAMVGVAYFTAASQSGQSGWGELLDLMLQVLAANVDNSAWTPFAAQQHLNMLSQALHAGVRFSLQSYMEAYQVFRRMLPTGDDIKLFTQDRARRAFLHAGVSTLDVLSNRLLDRDDARDCALCVALSDHLDEHMDVVVRAGTHNARCGQDAVVEITGGISLYAQRYCVKADMNNGKVVLQSEEDSNHHRTDRVRFELGAEAADAIPLSHSQPVDVHGWAYPSHAFPHILDAPRNETEAIVIDVAQLRLVNAQRQAVELRKAKQVIMSFGHDQVEGHSLRACKRWDPTHGVWEGGDTCWTITYAMGESDGRTHCACDQPGLFGVFMAPGWGDDDSGAVPGKGRDSVAGGVAIGVIFGGLFVGLAAYLFHRHHTSGVRGIADLVQKAGSRNHRKFQSIPHDDDANAYDEAMEEEEEAMGEALELQETLSTVERGRWKDVNRRHRHSEFDAAEDHDIAMRVGDEDDVVAQLTAATDPLDIDDLYAEEKKRRAEV